MTDTMAIEDSVALNRGRRNIKPIVYRDSEPISRPIPPQQQRKKKTCQPTPEQTKQTCKLAPARTIHGFLEIEAHFRTRIRDQDTAIQHIAASLSRALANSNDEKRDTSETSIYTMTLCGPTGCGKTETALALKNFLGMDNGYEYGGQFIELDGSTYGESTQINSVTGGGAGLVGYQDGNSLSERLLKAVDDYRTSDDAAPPPYLMLFIDEIDKADPGFLRNLNGLLGAGKYVSPSGKSFYLPQGTLLFVVLTANYGASAIAAMTGRNDDLAQQYIREDMRSRDMQDCTIGRLGQLLPYYPIKREILYALMVEKLETFIACSPMAKRYGAKNILYKEEVKEGLVNSVLDKMDHYCGIRGGLEHLFKKLNLLFEISYAKLNAMIHTKECSPELGHSIHIDTHTFDVKELFRKEITQILHKDIIETIREIPANKQCIEQCPADHDGVVNAVGMRYGDKQLCNLIMGFNFHTIINNYGNAETTLITQSLQAKLKRAKRKEKIMRDCLTELSDATRKRTTLKQIKSIVERNQALLRESLSDESDDHGEETLVTNPDLPITTVATPVKTTKRPRTKSDNTPSSVKKPKTTPQNEEPIKYRLVPREGVTIEEITMSGDESDYSVYNEEEFIKIFMEAKREKEEAERLNKKKTTTDAKPTPKMPVFDEELSIFSEVSPMNSSYEEDSNDPEVILYDNLIRDHVRRIRGGRPPREYEGFRRIRTKNKTAILECHACKKRINSRYAKQHKCEEK